MFDNPESTVTRHGTYLYLLVTQTHVHEHKGTVKDCVMHATHSLLFSKLKQI